MRISVQSRSGRDLVPGGVNVPDGATVDDLKRAIHKAKAKLYPDRQRITLPPKAGEKRGVPLVDGKSLADFGLTDGSAVLFKDLGPQVGWTTVFFWEYFGPLAVYPLFYFLPHVFYPWAGDVPDKAPVQTLALAYYSLHYAKRILETFFVHRFSHATMPISNLAKNCSYYWGFTAWISYFINHPQYTPPCELQSYAAFALALLCQLSNLRCHLILSNLRPPGSREYAIPSGFLFNYVTCANYTTEIWGWCLFAIGTQSLTAALFAAAGALQMADWARSKHKRMLKLFDGKDGRPKYPRRWVMLPPIF